MRRVFGWTTSWDSSACSGYLAAALQPLQFAVSQAPAASAVDQQPYGPRVPLIVVGRFARRGTVSHQTLEHSSITKFVEWNWLKGKTGQLSGRDQTVHNLGSLLAANLSVEQVGDQIELTVADDGVGMRERDSAKIPEKRGSNYVAIFVRQLGGTVVPSGSEETGTIVRIRLPLLLVPPEDPERVAA